MQLIDRVAIAFGGWIIMMFVTSWILGPERKFKWFRQRNQHKSFLNRRGFMGEYIHFGYPCTKEGWAVFSVLIFVVIVTAYIAVFI